MMKQWYSVALAAVWLFVGCGGPDLGTPVTVTGRITLDGQPLADAQVTFHCVSGLPAEHRSRVGKTDAEGKYELSNVYPAEYQVMVEKFTSGDVDPDKAPAEAPAEDPLSKYGAETPLRANVSPERSSFDFPLESK